MPIDIGAARLLLDTFANVSGNARARARDRILALLTASAEPEPEGWREERDRMQATIDRQREADARLGTMLTETRLSRDAALATLAECRKAMADATAAKVPRR